VIFAKKMLLGLQQVQHKRPLFIAPPTWV